MYLHRFVTFLYLYDTRMRCFWVQCYGLALLGCLGIIYTKCIVRQLVVIIMALLSLFIFDSHCNNTFHFVMFLIFPISLCFLITEISIICSRQLFDFRLQLELFLFGLFDYCHLNERLVAFVCIPLIFLFSVCVFSIESGSNG